MRDAEFADHLRVVDAMLTDLPALAEDWPTLGPADCATAAYEWSEAMARLGHLVADAAAPHSNPSQRVAVAELRRRLRGALPVAASIGLRDPRAAELAGLATV